MEHERIEKAQASNIKTIRTAIVIITIPLILYIFKLLPFIFVPLVSGLFLAILFTPLMRWAAKKKIPKVLALIGVAVILVGFGKILGELGQLSSQEIMNADTDALKLKVEDKLIEIAGPVEEFFGINKEVGDEGIKEFFQGTDGGSAQIMAYFGSGLNLAQKFITQVLMMFFFMFLFLAGSVDFQQLMNTTVVKRRNSSIKTMLKIEKSIVKFIIVKFILSAFTGLGFGLACWGFDVSFPIFWGLFACAINFVQMVGSVIACLVCGIFSLAELDSTGTVLAFWACLIGTQVLFGGILEPILMGKTFSINTVTVLVMLMLWGYIWGVPGLILSIPITVLIKIILETNPKTEKIARIMS